MFYNSSNSFEYNDCISRGACSVSPTISSMQEVMFILLRQIAFYTLKLRDFNLSSKKIIDEIIFQIAFIDAAKDFTEKQILEAFSRQYSNLVQSRKEYLKLCKEKNLKCEDLKNLIKLSPKTNLSEILKRGDREYLHKYKKANLDKKYYIEILSGVMKSVCVNLVTLNEYNCECEIAVSNILNTLNLFNSSRVQINKIKKHIDELAYCDLEILKLINDSQIKLYGKPEQTEVSHSTKPNKAIMVSGSDLSDLKNLLLATKDLDIDIYTNGNLLIAHAFPYFKSFKNLVGHFGSGVFNTILDFATFPGAILLTQNEAQNIEYLYRGRLFTTDEITPKGVVKIENNDFNPLINSALQAKGFAKGQKRASEIVGIDEKSLNSELDKIIKKNPNKIYIIGHSNLSIQNFDYLKKFFDKIDKNDYAITFSYNPHKENVLAINIGNDYAILYGILRKIFEKIPANSDNLEFCLTKCDINSLSNIINLKNKGVKNIYLSDCPPLVINPAVLRAFNKMFDVKQMKPQNT